MKQYTDTDQRLHLLCQVITKANRTFIEKKENDSHTNLYFDILGNRITGRWIETQAGKLLFTLNLKDLTIQVINSSETVLISVISIGNKLDDIELELERKLLSMGLDTTGFKDELHFDIPVYSFHDEPISALSSEALHTWKHYRQLANEASALLLGHAQVLEEIRIWPHHFDTGIYILINPNLGLGFGLAMEDDLVGTPYFYMSGYPIDSTVNYVNLPLGKDWKWEVTEHWKGAVLPLTRLAEKPDAEQKELLINFICKTYQWYAAQ